MNSDQNADPTATLTPALRTPDPGAHRALPVDERSRLREAEDVDLRSPSRLRAERAAPRSKSLPPVRISRESPSRADADADPSPAQLPASEPEAQDTAFLRFCEEQACAATPTVVHWYAPLPLPKSTVLIFNDNDLYEAICDFCRCLQNVEVSDTGRITRTICDSCRIVISRHPSSCCTGGTPECVSVRYVDEVGAAAPLCRGCYGYEEAQRRRRRDGHHARNRDRGRRGEAKSTHNRGRKGVSTKG